MKKYFFLLFVAGMSAPYGLSAQTTGMIIFVGDSVSTDSFNRAYEARLDSIQAETPTIAQLKERLKREILEVKKAVGRSTEFATYLCISDAIKFGQKKGVCPIPSGSMSLDELLNLSYSLSSGERETTTDVDGKKVHLDFSSDEQGNLIVHWKKKRWWN